MAHTNSTTNYGLPQWIGSDKPTFLGDFNSAFNTIDTQMKSNADTAVGAAETASSANATAISANETAVAADGKATLAKNTADAATSAAQSASDLATVAKNTADSAARTAQGNNIANLAPSYDNTRTYSVGELVTYVDENNSGKLYKCIVAWNTPGAFNINYWDDVTASEVFEHIPKIIFEYTGGSTDTYKDVVDKISDNAFFQAASKDILKNLILYKYKAAPDTHIEIYRPSGVDDGGITLFRIINAATSFGGSGFNIPKNKESSNRRYFRTLIDTDGTVTTTDYTNQLIDAGDRYVLVLEKS